MNTVRVQASGVREPKERWVMEHPGASLFVCACFIVYLYVCTQDLWVPIPNWVLHASETFFWWNGESEVPVAFRGSVADNQVSMTARCLAASSMHWHRVLPIAGDTNPVLPQYCSLLVVLSCGLANGALLRAGICSMDLHHRNKQAMIRPEFWIRLQSDNAECKWVTVQE